MLKQSTSRTHRSKGFKVKHFLQICLFLGICIWLLNHLKHSYDKKNAYDNSTGKISEQVQSKYEVVKLGRKHLHPRVDETALGIESQLDKAELEEEVEEIKPQDLEDDERGGGDDEIDGHDQERAEEDESEEVEDLIDVDDRERDVGSEEQESEEKGNRLEDASNNQSRNNGERFPRQAREEHFKGDDASNFVGRDTQTLSTEFEIGGLRKIRVTFESNGRGNVQGEEKVNKFDLANSYFSSESSSYTETSSEEKPEVKLNSNSMLVISSGYRKDKLPKIIQESDANTIGEYTFLQAVSRAKKRSASEAVEGRHSNVDSALSTVTANLDAVDSGVTKHIVKSDTDGGLEDNNGITAINKNNIISSEIHR
ncbi:MATH and LRR domain-containing protein PFE0570w [Ricinus communis]|uniref:Uncharacterized protein n=1 Tax=Ricinus communis TaxID=3988 RepID=B9R6S8_RICCO|nr:MATH and LRR domain-containing protein PFE0570w [Ricinus communis]XP_048226965.1 MATH and LRR domain-containing protein PFE0570w [Ricinus communis]XP_048226966.1 MATH and LRR domain-containing protein PFE0570w [Ricinus communis]XP_048226967.1 MATH and LRR domain-containing protein PFE0570w [Ricinus communis]XP_048226968.1 MATH and LRR domain-containing protein PFE0570w [Ricinus communis]EEF52208.1 conserved hypothetical protein [Ricinus communis]|eukprot:XP_002510021.1 MATH and LRR domain-containing protein PFE0570w [Ricinus communis]